MKRITLCADDYAYNDTVSDSILTLIKDHRLSATSCMTNMPNWPSAAKKLQDYGQQIDVGLHLNLTEGPTLSFGKANLFQPLPTLLKQAYSRRLSHQRLTSEIRAQLDCFAKHFGRLPDYIDGHQHAHQFPMIRKALLEVYLDYFPNKDAYIRVPSNVFSEVALQSRRCTKMMIIAWTGAGALRKLLQKHSIKFNRSFSGVYDFNPEADFRSLFATFVSEVKDKGIIMCHPSQLSSQKTADPIARARENEFNYLNSAEFITDQQDFVLSKF